jgi:hypothetical protein
MEPLFSMFSEIGLCIGLKVPFFFQAKDIAEFGGLNCFLP